MKKSLLKIKRKISKKRPEFRRQEGYRHKKLKKSWRRPKGRHSKLRVHEKPRGRIPSPGYASPKKARGLNRLGFREIRVSNPKDLKKINPKEEMALIAGTVGKKKRLEIQKKAKEMEIKIVNVKDWFK